MARPKYLECPICNADVPLSGDEKPGTEIFCAYCRAPLKLSAELDSEDAELEGDF